MGSEERKDPIATRSGTPTIVSTLLPYGGLTCLFVLFQHKTGRLSERNRPESGENRGHAVRQESLRLVDIVDALATASDVLRQQRANIETTGADAENDRVLGH